MKPTVGRVVHVYGTRLERDGMRRRGPYAAIVTEVGLPDGMIGVTCFLPPSDPGNKHASIVVQFHTDWLEQAPDGWFAVWPPREDS